MKINFQSVLDVAKKIGKKIADAFCKFWDNISSVYGEYDIDVKCKTHLTPAKVDENGSEQNVVDGSYKGQLKISVKDIVRFLAIFLVVFSLIKMIVKRTFR